MKVIFDIANITIAALFSFYFFSELQGVREGTIYAACTTGFIVRMYTRMLKKIGFYKFIGNNDTGDRSPGCL